MNNISLILKKEDEKNIKYFKNEVHYLDILTKNHTPNVIKYISSGQGPVIRKDRNNGQPLIKRYIVLEYAKKRELYDYIVYAGKGFGEVLGKIIFVKILVNYMTKK